MLRNIKKVLDDQLVPTFFRICYTRYSNLTDPDMPLWQFLISKKYPLQVKYKETLTFLIRMLIQDMSKWKFLNCCFMLKANNLLTNRLS